MNYMAEELSISGDNLIHALEYVKKKKGIEGLNWVVCEIGEDIESILPEKMYPFEIYMDMLEIIKSNFEGSDSNIISRIGFDRAKSLSAFEYHKKKADPIDIFKMVQKNWGRFNGFGRIKVKENEDIGATIYLCDFPASPLYCERMEGFLKGIVSAVCDRKEARVIEYKCRGKGDDYCKFEVSWRTSKTAW